MATKKVIDMTARVSSSLSYDDYVYLTKEVPLTDEKMQASVMRDYVLSGVKTSANSGLAQTSTSYAAANPDYELTLDVNNLAIVTPVAGDYISIEDVTDNTTKKVLVSAVVGLASGTVTSVTGGTNLTASPTTGATIVNLDATLTGLTSVTSTDFVGDLTGDVTGDVTGDLTGDVTGDVTGDLTGDVTGDVTGDLTGTASIATALAATLGVTAGGTGLTTVAKGSVLAVNAADTISAVAGVTNGHVLTYDSGADTVGWAAPGHITSIEGTSILSTSETGTAKFLRIDGDNSCSWQVPPDVDTTYTAGDGLDLSVGNEFSVDLMANGGLEITTTELSVAAGISQYDVAQFATGVVDNDFLKIDGTAVEGRSASEVKTDLSLDNVENTALSTWTGSTNVTTLGTIATGTWEGTTVAVDQGGTGQTSYTNGQLLIGNTTGNTLAKATLTAGTNITITEGAGSITIAAAAGGDPAGTAVAMAIALGG